MLYRGTRISMWGICISVYLLCSSTAAIAQEFHSGWPKDVQRVWVGPEYWANRLQDWRISEGRLECVEGRAEKPMRTVHLLTRRLGAKESDVFMSVRTGLISGSAKVSPDSAAGFLIGAGGEVDYRAAALVHHSFGQGGGIIAAMESTGRAVFRDMTAEGYALLAGGEDRPESLPDEVELSLTGKPAEGAYKLELTVRDAKTGNILSQVTLEDVDSARLVGNVALVSHPSSGKATGRFWFRDWKVSGSKFEVHRDRLCGPILCTQYTLHRNILKMTAQMMPLGPADTQTVKLQTKQKGGWKTIATTKIIVPGYTAPFRVENWDSTKDIPYRVVYELKQDNGSTEEYSWSGAVQHNPVDKTEIVVAAFTGNHNVRPWGVGRGRFPWTAEGVWFPHNDIVGHVAKHKPDLLFFSGDQHLGSTIQYGVDGWNDAGFALCVPSIGNCWPRRWFPPHPGRNHKPGTPAYTGEYRDGFGNLMTVHAVSNPVACGREPAALHDRAPGYGIVKFDRSERTIKIECWPRYADPADPKTGGQYPGWPITIKQGDNYGRRAAAWLPMIKVSGQTCPVVQVINEENGEIIYTLRIKGMSFRPKVFKAGAYTIKVGEPGTERMKTLKGVRSIDLEKSQTVEVNF